MSHINKLIIKVSKITNTTDDIVYIRHIIKVVHDYFDPTKYFVTTTKNLQLSRNSSLNFIIKNRLRTCGSLSYVTAVLLRKLGYKVRLIHGKRKVSGHWMYHAWIEVKLKRGWQPFDLFAKNFRLDKNKNRKISVHQTWKELKPTTKK